MPIQDDKALTEHVLSKIGKGWQSYGKYEWKISYVAPNNYILKIKRHNTIIFNSVEINTMYASKTMVDYLKIVNHSMFNTKYYLIIETENDAIPYRKPCFAGTISQLNELLDHKDFIHGFNREGRKNRLTMKQIIEYGAVNEERCIKHKQDGTKFLIMMNKE